MTGTGTIAAIGLFAALQLADAGTTLAVLRSGGREANPAMRWVFGLIGAAPALALVKLALIALCVVLVDRPFAPQVIAALSALYVYVVINNLRVLKDLRSRP